MAQLARIPVDVSRTALQFVELHPAIAHRLRTIRAALAHRIPERRRLLEWALLMIVVAAALAWVWVLWTQPMNRR
ncbi:MAG TPA: hypothetical protein VNL18_13530 [Gemmatimonadales bacterium]|nr:hypothetical protein [Gemmatimonadales bacterium]